MRSEDFVRVPADSEFTADKVLGRQSVLVSRVESCHFWITAAFLGCLFLCGWKIWCSAAVQGFNPLDTINPNIAPKESLVRLPGIGLARAMEIVAYRQSHSDNGPAFQKAEDLDAVAGLGSKTIEEMKPWISFDCPE